MIAVMVMTNSLHERFSYMQLVTFCSKFTCRMASSGFVGQNVTDFHHCLGKNMYIYYTYIYTYSSLVPRLLFTERENAVWE